MRLNKQKHTLLKKTCKNWEDYMKGTMGTDNYGVDCSSGCYYFMSLDDNGDWGVCCNPDSPRAGLLTWEHMGCINGFR